MSPTPPERFVTVFVTEKCTQDPMASPSPTQLPVNPGSHSYGKDMVLIHLDVGVLLHRSIAMMTTVFLLGTGVAIMLVA